MPVYDFSSGFNALNRGIQSLGEGLSQANTQAYQQQVGAKLAAGDYDGAAAIAYAHGDIDTGQKLAQAKFQKDAIKSALGDSAGSGGVFGNTTTSGSAAPTDQSASAADSGVGPQAAASGQGLTPQLAPVADKATQQYGLHPAYLPTTLAIESAGGRNLGKRGNPGQFDQATADKVGMPDATSDPTASVVATGALAAQNAKELATRIGREPTPAEVYLAHQQGVGGAAALINHPNEPAGKYVGSAAISQNGGDPNAPASQFVRGWQMKWNTTAQRLGFASVPNSVFASSGGTTGGPVAATPAAPVAGGTDMAGQPAARAPDGIVYGGPNAARDAGAPPAPIQVASAGGVPTPDTGPVAPPSGVGTIKGAPYGSGAPPPVAPQASVPPAAGAPAVAPAAAPAAAGSVPQATIDKFQADNPGTVGDEIKRPDGSFELNEPDDAAQAWATKNAAKYGLVQDPADPTHFMAAAASGAAPAAAAPPPSLAAVAISNTPANPNTTPAQAKASVSQLLSSLPVGDQRRQDFLQGQQMKYARLAIAGVKGADEVAKVYATALSKEQEAAAETRRENAPPPGYRSYEAQEIAANRTPLSQNDWQHQNSEKTIRKATEQEKIDYPGVTGMYVDENGKALKPFYAPSGAKPTPQQEYDARLPVAQKLGLQPGTAEFNSYMTGGPAGKQPFSTAEEKLISEADDKNTKLTLALGALTKAQKILPNTRSGATAGLMTWVDRNDPTGVLGTPKVGADTTEYDNLVQSTALGILKELFGGRVTNFEDQQFQALQPNSGKSMQEKQQILADLVDRYTSQQQAAQAKLVRLQGKTYFGAQGPGAAGSAPNAAQGPNPSVKLQDSPGGPPRPNAAWTPPAVVPPDAREQAKAAILANPAVRPIVIQRLQQMHVDPSGL